MALDNARSNYTEDRSTNFKHHVPAEVGLKSMPTAQDFVQNEKSKQMSRMRDWYLESKNQDSSAADLVSMRKANFSSSRKFSTPSPIQELDHYKGYLIGAALTAAAVGVVMNFVHL